MLHPLRIKHNHQTVNISIYEMKIAKNQKFVRGWRINKPVNCENVKVSMVKIWRNPTISLHKICNVTINKK